MSKLRTTAADEINVWPAVTDTVLLMASIFIVLAVVSLVSIVRKIDDMAGAGSRTEGERLKFASYSMGADELFDPGEDQLLNRTRAQSILRQIIADMAQDVDKVKRFADQQKDWKGDYFIVIEVAGHTDWDPMQGDKPPHDGNWGLAARRADCVLKELMVLVKRDKLGLGAQRERGRIRPAARRETIFRLAGYSSHIPLKSPDAKEANRRVEIRMFAQPGYTIKYNPQKTE